MPFRLDDVIETVSPPPVASSTVSASPSTPSTRFGFPKSLQDNSLRPEDAVSGLDFSPRPTPAKRFADMSSGAAAKASHHHRKPLFESFSLNIPNTAVWESDRVVYYRAASASVAALNFTLATPQTLTLSTTGMDSVFEITRFQSSLIREWKEVPKPNNRGSYLCIELREAVQVNPSGTTRASGTSGALGDRFLLEIRAGAEIRNIRPVGLTETVLKVCAYGSETTMDEALRLASLLEQAKKTFSTTTTSSSTTISALTELLSMRRSSKSNAAGPSSGGAAPALTVEMISDTEEEEEEDADEFDFRRPQHRFPSSLASKPSSGTIKRQLPITTYSSRRVPASIPAPPLPKSTKKTPVVLLDDDEDEDLELLLGVETRGGRATRGPVTVDLEDTHARRRVMFTFPRSDYDAVTITERDFLTLEHDTFLNDSVIDFFGKYVTLKGCLPFSASSASKEFDLAKCGEPAGSKAHVFTSHLFTVLEKSLLSFSPEEDAQVRAVDLLHSYGEASAWAVTRRAEAYAQVRRWSIGIDVFDKTCLVFPINRSLHWSVALVVFAPSQEASGELGRILMLDSFNEESPHDATMIASVIRLFLNHELVARALGGATRAEDELVRKRRKLQRVVFQNNAAEASSNEPDEIQVLSEQDRGQPSHPTRALLELQAHQHRYTETTLPAQRIRVSQQHDSVNCGVHLIRNMSESLDVIQQRSEVASLQETQEAIQTRLSAADFNTLRAEETRDRMRGLFRAVERQVQQEMEAERAHQLLQLQEREKLASKSKSDAAEEEEEPPNDAGETPAESLLEQPSL